MHNISCATFVAHEYSIFPITHIKKKHPNHFRHFFMNNKNSIMYFIIGAFFGFFLMLLTQEKNPTLTEKQLIALSASVSESISSKLSDDNQIGQAHDISKTTYSNETVNSELINKIKNEISVILTNELLTYKQEILETINNHSPKTIKLTENDYNQYHQAQLLLMDISNGKQMNFQQLTSDPGVTNLPDELRNRLLGEMAMKLNSGELNPDTFIGKNN